MMLSVTFYNKTKQVISSRILNEGCDRHLPVGTEYVEVKVIELCGAGHLEDVMIKAAEVLNGAVEAW